MSSEIWQIEKTICRCCHTEGTFHNLAEPRPYLGELEIYSEMLRECFNIVVTPMPGELCSLTYAICSSCISKLRDASIFKKQVQSSEERFMELYYKNAIHVVNHNSTDIKEEPDLIDFKEEYLNISEDDDFEIGDDRDHSTEDDMDVPLSTKAKGKGKTKVDKVVKVKPKKQKLKEEMDDEKESAAERKKVSGLDQNFTLTNCPDGSKNFSCKLCGRNFKRRELFSQHYNHVHLKRRPKLRSCHLCSVKVPTHMRALHMEEHGLPAPTCNACGKKFYYPFQVILHQKTYHMGEKRFACDFCQLRFSRRTELNKHQIIHTPHKPFKCEFCEKSFKWKKNLQTHIFMHMNIRQHVCSLCQQAFVQQSSLKYHLMKKHPELP